MGLLSRLFGRDRGERSPYGPGYTDPYAQQGYGYARPDPSPQAAGRPGQTEDERAIERYRYLLRTAPPDQVEAAHAEAFGKLTPDQRRQVLEQLSAAVPASERPRSDDPQTLARAATRAEFRQPGFLERTFSGGGYGGGYGQGGYGGGYGPGYGRGGFGGGFGGGGMGMGSMIGGSLLGTVAGVVVGSAVADALFDTGLGDGGLFGGGDEEAYAEGYQDGEQSDDGGDGGGDSGDGGGGYDAGGSDGGGFDGGGFDGGGFDGGGDFGGEF
jgi:hypothetical protein